MLLLDRDPDVIEYSCQTVEFIWPIDSAVVSHVPDLFVRLKNGDCRIVDVHDELDERFAEQRRLTQQACDDIGWEYEVFTGLGSLQTQTLLWLSADRHWWIVAGHEETLTAILERAQSPISVRELCSRVNPDHPHVVRPIVYHALWHRLLDMQWGNRFRSNTLVWTNPETIKEMHS